MKPTSLFKPPTTPASACPRIPKGTTTPSIGLTVPADHPSFCPRRPYMSNAPKPSHQLGEQFQNRFFAQSSGSFMPPLESPCVFPSYILFLSLFSSAHQTFALHTAPLGIDVANRHSYNRSIPHSSVEECGAR